MPRITPVNWKVLECVFKKAGFHYERKNGSHRVYSKDGCLRPIIIPEYKEVQLDIIQANLRTAKMTRVKYFEYLAECQ